MTRINKPSAITAAQDVFVEPLKGVLQGRGSACCPEEQQTRRTLLCCCPCLRNLLLEKHHWPSCFLLSSELQGTVYISKSRSKGRPAIYRFSLNASVPAPWQMVSPGDGEVPSFQVSQSRDTGPPLSRVQHSTGEHKSLLLSLHGVLGSSRWKLQGVAVR